MEEKIILREYVPKDSVEAGILISDTYRKYNLAHIDDSEIKEYLGGFHYCRSSDEKHRETIARLISAPVVFVAESCGRIAGILRGRPGRLHSLFVHEDFHRKGVGTALMQKFEDYNKKHCSKCITMSASLYAVPFYASLGYKKSTGVRRSDSFKGRNFHVQPMKKILV